MYTRRRVVVRPGSRAGTSQRLVAVLDVYTALCRVGVVLAAVGVTVWQSAVLPAKTGQQAPLRRRHAVPSLALGETGIRELVCGNAGDRLHVGQAVRFTVNHGVLVDRNVNLVVYLAADDERRVRLVLSAVEQVFVVHAAEAVHDAGNACVVVYCDNIPLCAGGYLFRLSQRLYRICFLVGFATLAVVIASHTFRLSNALFRVTAAVPEDGRQHIKADLVRLLYILQELLCLGQNCGIA